MSEQPSTAAPAGPVRKSAFSAQFSNTVVSIARDAGSSGLSGREAIHGFRLSVKYLRTILDVADCITRKKARSEELRDLLAPVFEAAGDVRSAQVNRALFREERAPGLAGCGPALTEDEETSRRRFASLLEGFDRARFERLAAASGSVIAGLENARVAVYTEKFLLARYGRAFKILGRVRTARDLHEVRKNMKAARYALRLLASCRPARRSGIEERIVRTVDQTLGRWHDVAVYRRRIRAILASTSFPGAEWAVGTPLPGADGDGPELLAPVVRDTRRRTAALRRVLRIG